MFLVPDIYSEISDIALDIARRKNESEQFNQLEK